MIKGYIVEGDPGRYLTRLKYGISRRRWTSNINRAFVYADAKLAQNDARRNAIKKNKAAAAALGAIMEIDE